MTKTEILKQCTVEGNIVKLPDTVLERKLYTDVAKIIVIHKREKKIKEGNQLKLEL
jgi:hypothetical protein